MSVNGDFSIFGPVMVRNMSDKTEDIEEVRREVFTNVLCMSVSYPFLSSGP